MTNRPDSFWGFIGSTYASIQGIVISALGIVLALIALAISPADSILLGKALAIIIVCLAIIITLLVAAYNLYLACRNVLPRVLTVKPYLVDGQPSSIMFLLEPSPLFTSNQQVSVYYYEDKIEQPIGLGTVVNIQEDGYIQIGILREFEGHKEVFRDLQSNKNFDLSKVKIKPSVPQFVTAPIQKPIEIEMKPTSQNQDLILPGDTATEGTAFKPVPSSDQSEKPQTLKAENKLDWAQELILSSVTDGEAKFQEIYQNIITVETDPLEKVAKETLYLWLRFCNGDTSALFKLQELTSHPEGAAYAYSYIGYCYNQVEQYDKAKEAFMKTVQSARNEGQKIMALINEAKCEVKLGKPEQAFKIIIQHLSGTTNIKDMIELYEGLALLYEMANDSEMRAIALEKVLQIKPNDTNQHFNAAYSYSERPLHCLALLHYKTLLDFDSKNSNALNNIAVEYGRLTMSIKAVEYYKKAVEQGETLAAANLAKEFLSSGFIEEALDELNKAKGKDNPHKDVANVIASIPKNQERESKSEEQALKDGRQQQSFLVTFADAYFIGYGNRPNLDGVWIADECPESIGAIFEGTEVIIKESDNIIEGNWERGGTKDKFKGVLSNWAARIITFEMKVYENDYKEDDFGYIYLSPEGTKIFIMRVFSERIILFATLSRTEKKQGS
jgi:tetratricopeptide (TPR) repeat protein